MTDDQNKVLWALEKASTDENGLTTVVNLKVETGLAINVIDQSLKDLEVSKYIKFVYTSKKGEIAFELLSVEDMSKQDKKPAKEASNIFHNIMKASVNPKKGDKADKVKPDPKAKK